MRKVSASLRPGIKQLIKGHRPGDILARVDIDPYKVSFWNSSTHVLAPRLDENSIRAALKTGHCYVAHDWICEATGFRFEALDEDGKSLAIIGDELSLQKNTKLSAQFPISCEARILRNGREIFRSHNSRDFQSAITEPGVYRLEAWLNVDDEARPWIFSNPIYVRERK